MAYFEIQKIDNIHLIKSIGEVAAKGNNSVYNFSDAHHGEKTVLPFTKDRQAIYQELCAYYGSRTSLRLRDLEEPRATTSEATPDLLLITDMQITNLAAIINLAFKGFEVAN